MATGEVAVAWCGRPRAAAAEAAGMRMEDGGWGCLLLQALQQLAQADSNEEQQDKAHTHTH